jgi:type I restriction enzyme S subunit
MKFQNGDTLIARITPCLENGKTCYVTFLDEEEIGWGSTEYIVIRMKKPFHPFISYIIAKDKDFRDFAISSMSGSSGRQRAQADVIKEYDIKIPSLAIIEELNLQLAGITKKLETNAKQIRTLIRLRDTLLPKLMSGEVRVKLEEEEAVYE